MNKRIAFKFISCIIAMVICIGLTSMNVFSEPTESFADDSSSNSDLLYSQIPVTNFQVSNLSPQAVTDMDYTDWWYSEWDDCRYIFLPATADRSKLTITYTTENDSFLYLNDEVIVSGEQTSLLGDDDEFMITVGETDCGILKIMQSNLGCIYISTTRGGLDALDANRYINESGSAHMLNANGGIEYSGKLEKITAHGNSSWDYSVKKSYNIKLPQKENLYEMGKAKNGR